MKNWLLILLFCFYPAAQAAQTGVVIVDSASVREFPQAGAKVVDQLVKDESVAVSNIPTEGFYKVRTGSGTIGWVSGNDVRVGAAPPAAPSETEEEPAEPPAPKKAKKKQKPIESVEEDDEDTEVVRRHAVANRKNEEGDNLRIIILGGIHSLSYGELIPKFSLLSSDLNPGFGGTFELQFKINSDFAWAIRTEVYSAQSPDINLGGGITLKVKSLVVPLQVGAIYYPFHSPKYRLGLGGYVGATVSNTTTVTETTVAEVKYSSTDPCGVLALQGGVSLGRHLGIAAELGYRYQYQALTKDSQYFGSGFKINYSGILARAGFEFKF